MPKGLNVTYAAVLLVQKIFLNKLAWADQECPVGKWNKIERS